MTTDPGREPQLMRNERDIYRTALRIIAGYEECLDNLLSDREVALEALRLGEEP